MKFLFTTLPSNDLGLLTRSLPVAVALTTRGHQVVFCSPGLAPQRLITEAGFDNLLPPHPLFYLLATNLSAAGMFQAVKLWQRDGGNLVGFVRQLAQVIPTQVAAPTAAIWNMDHLAAVSGMLNERLFRAGCEALRTLIRASEVDAVVDFCNPFACVAARALGKPLISILQADMHPASRGFIWWQEPPANLPSVGPGVNKVLAGYGLPPIRRFDELLVGDLTLLVGMPATDPLPATAQAIYVGALLWQNPAARLPEWVDHLRPDQPVIWVYSGNPRYLPGFSTPVDSAVVVHACVKALAGETVQVVLTTGHHPLPRSVLPLPNNFYHAPFVPGLAMAERSDVLIHHGGYGSCQTGLYAGKPAVIIPTYSERESNARRIVAVGASEMVLPVEIGWGRKQVRVEELRARVIEVWSNPNYAANARRMQAKLRAYGGATAAAQRIESFVL